MQEQPATLMPLYIRSLPPPTSNRSGRANRQYRKPLIDRLNSGLSGALRDLVLAVIKGERQEDEVRITGYLFALVVMRECRARGRGGRVYRLCRLLTREGCEQHGCVVCWLAHATRATVALSDETISD